jgi:hypothetical protein
MMIGQLGGPALAGLFSPDPQEANSFPGAPEMMSQLQSLLGGAGSALTSRAMTPVSLPSAVAQQPTAFTGGGLPFPVGLSATDPALGNPSLLNLPGMGEFAGMADLFAGMSGGGGPRYGVPKPGNSNPPGAGIDPGDTAGLGDGFEDFYQQPFDQRTPQNPNGTSDGGEPNPRNAAEFVGGPRRPSMIRTGDILNDNPLMDSTKSMDGGEVDDLDQAHGAARLLAEAIGGGDLSFLNDLFDQGAQPFATGRPSL